LHRTAQSAKSIIIRLHVAIRIGAATGCFETLERYFTCPENSREVSSSGFQIGGFDVKWIEITQKFDRRDINTAVALYIDCFIIIIFFIIEDSPLCLILVLFSFIVSFITTFSSTVCFASQSRTLARSNPATSQCHYIYFKNSAHCPKALPFFPQR
jgi:hypothetical protein